MASTSGDIPVKNSPVYTPILKLVIKSQIQFLVNQLAEHGEQCLLLTANVKCTSSSHLGTISGLNFMKTNHSIGKDFLQFCRQSMQLNSLHPEPNSQQKCTSLTRQAAAKPNTLNTPTDNILRNKRAKLSKQNSSEFGKVLDEGLQKETKSLATSLDTHPGDSEASSKVLACGLDLECDSVVDMKNIDEKTVNSDLHDDKLDSVKVSSVDDPLLVNQGSALDNKVEATDEHVAKTEDGSVTGDQKLCDSLDTNYDTFQKMDIEHSIRSSTETPLVDSEMPSVTSIDIDQVMSTSCPKTDDATDIKPSPSSLNRQRKAGKVPRDILLGDENSHQRYKKKRRLSLCCLKTKYDALEEVERGVQSKSQIARQFGVPCNTLSTWLKNAEKIKESYLKQKVDPSRKKITNASNRDIEHAVLDWIGMYNKDDEKLPITTESIIDKANKIARSLGYSSAEFQCNIKWVNSFKVRHGFDARLMNV